MPIDREIRFEPVGAEHFALLERWLTAPHIKEWWGEPAEELGYIRDMVEGRDTTRPFLIVMDDLPIGYIQYWFIGHHQNAKWLVDHPWLAELPSDTVGVDLSIGEPELLSRGIGSRAVRAFAEMLTAEGYRSIIIDPDPANLRAVRAYEKAGFRPIPALVGRSKDALIMQYEPNTTGLTP